MSPHGTAAEERSVLAHLSPWHEQGLRVGSLRGRERLSAPYRFDLRALTPEVLGPERLPPVGTPLTLALFTEAPGRHRARFVHGVLTRTQHHGIDHDREGSWLGLRLEPRLVLLRRHRTRRVFQERTLAQLADMLLAPHRVAWRWAGELPTQRLAYAVQYDETDFDFLRRVLARFGVLFYFEHAAQAHGAEAHETLVLCDDARQYAPLGPLDGTHPRALRYAQGDARDRSDEALLALEPVTRVRPTAVRVRDVDVRTPQQRPDHARSVETEAALGRDALRLEDFEHRSGNDEVRFRPLEARVALEQARAGSVEVLGRSDCVGLSAGVRFCTEEHPLEALDARWVVTEVVHQARVATLLPHAAEAPGYANRFRAVPADRTVRPARPARVLRQVCETAVVVGPVNEEVFTDALGRIKVQFHWDRDGRFDEQSSCWVRVAQALAGNGWGSQFLPRVGMEVLVTYVAGDTDHPLVTACLYNGSAAAPFALPATRTRSGLRTRSSPGGTGYNELSFEDAAGNEQVLLRAQRDLDVVVGRHHSVEIHGDERSRIGGNRVHRVESDSRDEVLFDREEAVGRDDTLRVGGSRKVSIGAQHTLDITGSLAQRVGGHARVVVEGASSESVMLGATTHVAGAQFVQVGGPRETHVAGAVTTHHYAGETVANEGPYRYESRREIVLRVGESCLTLGPDSVRIEAPSILLLAGNRLRALGNGARLELEDRVRLEGSSVRVSSPESTLRLTHEALLRGSKVKLGSGSGAAESALSEKGEPSSQEREWAFRLTEPAGEGRYEAVANVPFTATGHGPTPHHGVTEADGTVRVPRVYPRARLRLDFGTWTMDVRAEDEPASGDEERAETLHRLGYGPGELDGWTEDDLERAQREAEGGA